jgi:hypothetical protein
VLEFFSTPPSLLASRLPSKGRNPFNPKKVKKGGRTPWEFGIKPDVCCVRRIVGWRCWLKTTA